MVYTYLLKSLRDGSFYTGITENLDERLKIHNNGGLKSSARKRPYVLAFFRKHASYQEARKHEIWLKKKNVVYKNRLAEVAQLAPPELGGVK
ncbi:MAG TPA: GIY-YIG nuclease family protein [Alphaproteobacteria bacterium]|nr:GIY-YIG nuclease family protein [Alphaproteobacteria bacterium]